MKIVLAGGGTGGHFYPIIAIADALRLVAEKEHYEQPRLFYISDDPYNEELLTQREITFVQIKTGKIRTYFSIQNFIDPFRIAIACMIAIWKLFLIYPDVVFGKGGYASFPTLFAARVLRIPVFIHESDISLGRVNRWVANYATRIGISYPETALTIKHKERTALIGLPLRKELLDAPEGNATAILGLEENVPTILVLGGSQGAENINEHIIDIINNLVEFAQVIHQTGEANLTWMKKRSEDILGGNPLQNRYKPFAYIDVRTMRLAGSVADIIISRAGSTIFEIAIFGKPSILIPLPIAREDHQRENAYSYARTGAAIVIEEPNLRSGVLLSVITKLLEDRERRTVMSTACKEFAHPDAGEKIATALINIALRHDLS